jgi:hypothetical protein
MKKFDMGKYILLVGNDATEIFDYYKVPEMHGLNLADAKAEEIDRLRVMVFIYMGGLTMIRQIKNLQPKLLTNHSCF